MRKCVRAHDVAKFVEVSGDREITVVAVTALNVLVDSVNVDSNAVQEFRLKIQHYRNMRGGPMK